MPYKSCSLFGSLRYLSCIKNSVSLINGPSGCAFFNRNNIVVVNGYYTAIEKVQIPKIFSIDFDEQDVIFGAQSKMEKAIDDIIKKYDPEVVFLFNCCVSEVIGEDIDSLAKQKQTEHGTLVLPVHSAGFKGDHKFGMRMACDILFDNFFCHSNEKCEDRVNILGDLDYHNRSSKVLIDVLNEIGINNINHIPGNASVNELMKASSASLNIVTCENASRHLANKFLDNSNIPYIGNDSGLYGIDNTYKTCLEIYNFFNKSASKLDMLYQSSKKDLHEIRVKLEGKKAFIVAGTRRAIGYSNILKELGIEIQVIFSESEEKYINKNDFLPFSENVLLNESPEDLATIIEKERPDFILSTLSELIAPHKYVKRLSDDFAGFTGSKRMGEYLLSSINSDDRTYLRIQE